MTYNLFVKGFIAIAQGLKDNLIGGNIFKVSPAIGVIRSLA